MAFRSTPFRGFAVQYAFRPPGKSIFTNNASHGSEAVFTFLLSTRCPSWCLRTGCLSSCAWLCVGLFLFSPAAVQPHEAAERGRGRPRKGAAVVVQGTGKSGQCRRMCFFCLMQMHVWLPKGVYDGMPFVLSAWFRKCFLPI